MSTTAPGDNIVPSTLNAGDTWQFTMSFANYPANSGWSAAWVLISNSSRFSFNATVNTNGTDFDFLVSATTTATVPAGPYAYRIIVTGSGVNAGQQFCADPPSPLGGYGRTVVSPSFASGTFNPLSAAEQELATLQATILTIESNPTASATFGGQTVTVFDLEKLKVMELRLIERVKDEQVRARVKAGLASGRQAQIRFVDPSFPSTGFPFQNRG